MLLTADLFELISTNLPRILVIAMVTIFLFTFFVELIKNDLLAIQIFFLKKRLRPYLMGQGTETFVSFAKLFRFCFNLSRAQIAGLTK
jgi:hypothetical protein